MKLSCIPVSFYDDIFSGKKSVVDWVHFAAALGLDGVDFSVKFFPTRERQVLNTISEMAQKVGIELCMLACYPDFTHPDAGQRTQEIEQMKADVRLTAALGARFARVTAGQNHPGIHREQGIRWAVEGLRQALDEADKMGVTLVYENHTKGAPWQYWDFSQPAEIFLEILNNLAETSLGVCFDTANPLVIGEEPTALLEAVIKKVVVVHAFDIRASGAFEPVLVGTGVSPIKQVFFILKRNGFDGWLSIEEASRTGEEGFEKAISFVRRAWEEA
jgi:sugar phosphate isomerase/epimerase